MIRSNVVYGCDVSKVQCRLAHINLKNLFASQGDIRSLPFASGVFNVILDVSTIDHVNQKDANAVLAEYSRLLCNDGLLILLYAQDMPFAKQYWNNQFEGVYLLDSFLIQKQLAKVNLTVISDRGIDFLHSFIGLPPKRFMDRFLVWHCPVWVQTIILSLIFQLEHSYFNVLAKRFAGLRVHVAVKNIGAKL
jgi:SAM-dependent methyltransferase